AYQEDETIEPSLRSFLNQEYPRDCYEVVVISDRMKEETNKRIGCLPVRLLKVEFENSSKAKALNFAVAYLKNENYDIVVILDADNTVEPDFLKQINRVYHAGIKAIQTHRKAKNLNTEIALLDAVSEEMNNAYFRKGHVYTGLSSALSGSGMAFDFKWFCANIQYVTTAGEDKELEVLLLKQRIFIEYLDHVHVYDEKIQSSSAFYKQRQRWLAAQFGSLKRALRDLPHAIFSKNIDYADKLLQWMMLPRLLLLGFSFIFSILLFFVQWEWALKWWGLLLLFIVTFGLAIPKELDNARLEKALRKIPLLFLLMFINLFRLKGVNKKFIHTKHGENNIS
ncbi:MAG: glycosyltransferase family 2 protein, partial [Mangrovibacterium sp.]|nr:glycosyltransferase family 2 protein [Mangrovibacterium sp.]